MARRQYNDAKLAGRVATVAAVLATLSGLAVTEAGAEPRAGAPIVFAHQRAVARATLPQVTQAPARVQAIVERVPSRRAPPVSADQPQVLYGYGGGGRSRGAAPPIDLRGALAAAQPADTLGDDAFESGAEAAAPGPVTARAEAPPPREVATTQPVAAMAAERPDWLEQERTGAPYQANGQWFVPTAEPGYAETGTASWYGAEFHGRRTASGEVFDAGALTAAHPTLPIPSLVQVTNLENGREVIVRVNDRGPFHAERLIDVSRRTAEVLGFESRGQARVHVRYLGPAPKLVAAGAAGASAAGAEAVVAPAMDASPKRGGAYVVQVGAFANVANVERARTTLSGTGEVLVDVRQSGATALHRVRVGSWATAAEAEAARVAVAERGFPGAVVASLR
jgi:rare lipoprotein A